jgi:hypothetical protein
VSAPKPYILHVIDAICESGLPPDLRHLLMVMAYKSDNDTGKGLTGQERIAEAMGLAPGKRGAREVRRKLERLEAAAAPVRVVRTPRFKRDGTRNSDEYHLVIDQRTSTSPGTDETSGRPRPLVGTVADERPADVGDATSGRLGSRPADVGVPGSTQGSTQMELRSLFVAPNGTTSRVLAAPKKGKSKSKSKPKREAKAKPKSERTPEELAAYNRTKDFYFEAFEAARGVKPVFGPAEGKNVYMLLEKLNLDVDAACAAITTAYQSFRARSVTILSIARDPQGFEAQPAKSYSRVVPSAQPGSGYDFERFQVGSAQKR